MSSDQHHEALRAYDDALKNLYQRSEQATVAALGGEAKQPVADDARAEEVVDASHAAGEAVSRLLDSDDERVREVGQAQLAALAARDFAVAHDLARLDPDEGATVASTESASTALDEIEPELSFVLSRDPREGLPISDDGWTGMATPAGGAAEDLHVVLEQALTGGIDKVRDATGEVVKDGLSRLGTMGVAEALGAAAGDLLEHLPRKVGAFWRWAVEMFRRGVEKLRQLFGTLFEKAIERIRAWVAAHAIDTVLDVAYGSSALKAELSALVKDAKADKDLAAVGKSVEEVIGKYETQKKVLLLLFKGLAFCKKWILHLVQPHGTIVVAGAFGLGIGYTVFSGGDYVDWRRTEDDGFFDFVKGIRTTAEEGLR